MPPLPQHIPEPIPRRVVRPQVFFPAAGNATAAPSPAINRRRLIRSPRRRERSESAGFRAQGLWLLEARRTADKRDELASSHLTPPRTGLVQCLKPTTL